MAPTHSNYTLRDFNHKNMWDVELVNLMKFHPAVMKAKGYWHKGFKYDHKVNLHEHEAEVTDKLEDIFYVVVDRLNRVAGWIWFYQNKRTPLPKTILKELGVERSSVRTMEVSYEKLMSDNWPSKLIQKIEHVELSYLAEERKGVIVEGLSQAIAKLVRKCMFQAGYKITVVLYAYVHPSNIASSKVLSRNGFTRSKRKYSYYQTPHWVWVKVV